MLTIVPTPIGNLKDITLRSLEVLKDCDEIICEDSRRTALLLNHYEITSSDGSKKPLIILNDFNESKAEDQILEKLRLNKNLALVSDAGTPLVSDPGFKIVRSAILNGFAVDSLPGPTSVTTALTLSALPPDKFMFLGYLPEKEGRRKSLILSIKEISKIISTTFIIFIAPHKLLKTLTEIKQILDDPQITIVKELTKIHQDVRRGKVSEILKNLNPKGEFILLLNLSP